MNGERVVVLGWSRAILMQLAHPLVAAGVHDHSTFRGGVAGAAVRLHNTVSAMLALTFGDADRRAAAVAKIRSIHRSVNGTLKREAGIFPAGTRYSADDPQLLLWVHATLVDSSALMYQRVIAPLSERELDEICDASVPYLTDLGGDAATAPRTWAALRSYMDRMERSGALVATVEARALANAILTPTAAGRRVPFTGVQRLLTVGLLPPTIRGAYEFGWSDTQDARCARVLATLRTARRVTPRLIARFRDSS